MENSGVVHMLMHTRTLELACVYKLLSRVGEGLRTVADAVSAHLREQGRALVTDTIHNTNAIAFVQVFSENTQFTDAVRSIVDSRHA